MRGPEVPLALLRALLVVLRAVFVALLTPRLRDSVVLLRGLADFFLAPLDRALLDAELLLLVVDLLVVDLILADLPPLDTLAVLPLLLLRPLMVFIAASSLPTSLAS
ncbi:MAG: hypothetical protein ACREA2_11470 [Blastocatellia bacterium]